MTRDSRKFLNSLDILARFRMRTSIIVIGVLAFTAAVYGFDAERSRKFFKIAEECFEEHGINEDVYVNSFICTLRREGQAIDKNGVFNWKGTFELINDLTTDKESMTVAQQEFWKCYTKEVATDEQPNQSHTRPIAKCSMIIMPVLLYQRPE